jgi:hypothetical protein
MGPVTFLLEIMTGHPTAVMTEYQHVIPADKWMAQLFGVEVGADIHWTVWSLSRQVKRLTLRTFTLGY